MRSHHRSPEGYDAAQELDVAAYTAQPGRRTLTSGLLPWRGETPPAVAVQASTIAPALWDDLTGNGPPVQRKGDPAAGLDGGQARAVAAQGFAGGGGAAPHLDVIQRSFGRHDVSGVQAHVGGAAADASAALGAEAYASGDHVAFARSPDVFLAAHELAHVVQQRGGVQLSRGVGAVGDAHEQHADRVAAAVVAGESAEPLLDQYAGGASADAGVQRNPRQENFEEGEGSTVEAAPRNVDAELGQHVATVLQSIPSWIALINQRVNPLTQGGELTDVDPILTGVVQNFRRARGIFESKVAAGAAVEAGQAAAISMVLGLLPGLGDVTGLLSAAAPFMREVEEIGMHTLEQAPEVAAAALQRPMGAIQSDAQGRTTAPLTANPPAPASGESGDSFALRAEQSKTAALRALLRCTQTAANLAQVSTQAQGLQQALAGGNATAPQREQARAINELRLSWPAMHDSIMSLTQGVAQTRQRLLPLRTAWSPAQLEVYMWLLWMAHIGVDGSSHLDPDPVEDRLAALGIIGPGSITGVDFGDYTTVADEMEAQMAGARHQRSILAALESYGALRLGGPG